MVAARGSSGGVWDNGRLIPKSGAMRMVSLDGVQTAVARICETGAAMAGRPYTTACSPNKITFPGADAEIFAPILRFK